jgi:precorrin-6Y C5,15-methyltransferase (decarboxylating)
VFDGLPAPDAVFVGGIRQEVARLLELAYKAMRPGGRLVVNVASIEGLSAVYQALKEIANPVQAMLVNISRGTEQLETLRFEALNPTFLLTVTKPAART